MAAFVERLPLPLVSLFRVGIVYSYHSGAVCRSMLHGVWCALLGEGDGLVDGAGNEKIGGGRRLSRKKALIPPVRFGGTVGSKSST